MPTTNMSLNEPSVGTTPGPTWATEVNENFTSIDQHDHTSGKGVQLTPSSLNINSDLEFNGNAAIELKRLTIDSSATGSGTNYSVYQSGGNLYWYNGSGQAVQITNGANVKTTGGSIDGMSGTDAAVDYGSGIYKFEFDSTKTPFAGAKMSHADINLYKYDGSSGSNAYVILKYTGSSEGSNNLTFPDETGTLLSTATSFAGAISVGATGGSGSITLDAAQDINLDSDTGVLTFKDGGTAIGKISNSSSDLVIECEVDAKDIIFKQYDGNEVVRMADDRRLYFYDKGGEYIYGDGTDLYLVSGADINIPSGIGLTFGNDGEKIEGNGTKLDIAASEIDFTIESGGDINIGANIGLTFGNDGEKIEGDGTDLTIASSAALNLTATTDVVVPANVGITFGTGEKIEGDNTDLTLTSGADINLTATADVNLPNNVGLVFGDDGEKIEGDGTDLTIASSGEININSGTLDLSAQTVDVTLNAAVDALNFDSNTLSIDASNNRVGIGTAAPDVPLHVKAGSDNVMIIESTDADANFKLKDSATGHFVVNNAGDTTSLGTNGRAEMMRFNSSTSVVFNEDGADQDFRVEGDANQNLLFADASTDRIGIHTDAPDMVLHVKSAENNLLHLESTDQDAQLKLKDSGGHFTINTANNNTSLGANGRAEMMRFSGTSGIVFNEDGASQTFRVESSSNINALHMDAAGGLQFGNYGSGTLSCDSAGNVASSDARLKNKTRGLDSGLDLVNQLKPTFYKWKEDSGLDRKIVQEETDDQEEITEYRGTEHLGFIAQEVQSVIPEASHSPDDPDRPLNFDDRGLIAVCVKAIQELSTKVTVLEGA